MPDPTTDTLREALERIVAGRSAGGVTFMLPDFEAHKIARDALAAAPAEAEYEWRAAWTSPEGHPIAQDCADQSCAERLAEHRRDSPKWPCPDAHLERRRKPGEWERVA